MRKAPPSRPSRPFAPGAGLGAAAPGRLAGVVVLCTDRRVLLLRLTEAAQQAEEADVRGGTGGTGAVLVDWGGV